MSSPFFISLPSTSPTTPNGVQATNTLAITSIPKESFEQKVLDVLHSHFASYGEINRWMPLPSFSRVLVTYTMDEAAEDAKVKSDPIVLEKTNDRSKITLRVFRADPNPLLDAAPPMSYLQLPPTEKNFLISPPGSPPIGWEPVKEDPPNATPLADDLIAALRKLQTHEKPAGLEVLVHPDDGDTGVGIYVEDCATDDDESESDEEAWVYGQPPPFRARWFATAMPPSIAGDA
ncbi:hypothetical protein MKEN_01365900 [Mycena kentingensis (nom. inval.)]|nr:hypothetical protein MKEN_01365900 [Mycena kentingensis (nom. inval.)]